MNRSPSALSLARPNRGFRGQLLKTLIDAGCQAQPVWMQMHGLLRSAGRPRDDVPVAEALEIRIIDLPSGAALADA